MEVESEVRLAVGIKPNQIADNFLFLQVIEVTVEEILRRFALRVDDLRESLLGSRKVCRLPTY
jgi:hypothetical protein